MQRSPSTRKLLDALQSFSQNKISRKEDLAILFELAHRHDMQAALNELSFLAKFLHNAYGMMERIGTHAEGYDKLSREFAESLEKASAILRSLIEEAPTDIRGRLTAEYLDLKNVALRNFLVLMYDLSWYKNWQIDHPDGSF